MNDVLHQKWQFECIAKFGIERYWKHICYVLWLDCLGQRARTEVWEKHSVTVLYAREEKQLGQHRLGHTPGLWTAMAENSRSMYHVRRQNSWEIYVYMIIYIHIIYIYIYYVYHVQKHSFRKLVGFVHKLFDGTFRISTWNSGRQPWVHQLSSAVNNECYKQQTSFQQVT